MRNAVPSSPCPHCRADVNVRANRVYPGILRDIVSANVDASPEAQIASASLVKCPKCGTQFSSNAIRFFGVLSPGGMRYLLIGMIFLFAAFGVYVAFFAQW